MALEFPGQGQGVSKTTQYKHFKGIFYSFPLKGKWDLYIRYSGVTFFCGPSE